uniref:Uncharacterized protein n=1 Tax=Pipistrellus kuhlii TaxID=59472 RepID=A0A7J7WDF5_PIPKU|nr:hypothetical protein mPipKuh1_008090 [Pipistrellus kuhlii]
MYADTLSCTAQLLCFSLQDAYGAADEKGALKDTPSVVYTDLTLANAQRQTCLSTSQKSMKAKGAWHLSSERCAVCFLITAQNQKGEGTVASKVCNYEKEEKQRAAILSWTFSDDQGQEDVQLTTWRLHVSSGLPENRAAVDSGQRKPVRRAEDARGPPPLPPRFPGPGETVFCAWHEALAALAS